MRSSSLSLAAGFAAVASALSLPSHLNTINQRAMMSRSSASGSFDFQTSEAGNPIADGWHADPDNEYYNGEHWVYTTYSHPYDEQLFLDAFSSADLVHWKKHDKVLNASDFKWAHRAVWAPAPVKRNGKYYLYFAANDIQPGDGQVGGIGVGVASKPEGPYKDAIGKPLIGDYYNGAQPIDQCVFVDDDGQAYMIYGGHSHANVVKLNEDMVSLGTLDKNGTIYREITPENYVEGPKLIKRKGIYYLFWSEGGWTGPDYAVSYAMANSPLGPWKRQAKILQRDEAVATGSGHNGVLNVPGTDEYYIVYHRHPLGATDGNDRQLSYDRLRFNDDGTIQTVTMLVHDNFADGNMLGWTQYDGHWSASTGQLKVIFSFGAKNLLDTNFANFTMEGDVQIDYKNGGDAGLLFRVSEPTIGTDAYKGYYAGLSSNGHVVLGRVNNGWTELQLVEMDVAIRQLHHLKVVANGDQIQVYVDDMATPKIQVTDGMWQSGMNGVRAYQTDATFDNIKVAHL